MNQIAFFLERFKNLEPHDMRIKRSVAAAFLEVLNVELKARDISVSKNGVIVNLSPAARSEALVCREELAEKIDSKLPLR